MRRDCTKMSKALNNYLHGHLFRAEQKKIERHLKKCGFCCAELEALKQTAATKRLLRDITPPEGVVQRVRESVSGLSRLKKLIYRPLWIAGIVAAAVVSFYFFSPQQGNVGKEGAGPIAESAAPSEQKKKADTAPASASKPKMSGKTATVPPGVKPLKVTLTITGGRRARANINAVMQGHAVFRTMRFTKSVKQISGNLTAKELITFFNRVSPTARIYYSRSHLKTFPMAQPIPFVITLREVRGKPKKPAAEPVTAESAQQAADGTAAQSAEQETAEAAVAGAPAAAE